MSFEPGNVEDELPAFVAGRAGPERAAEIEAWIAGRAGREEFIADWQRIARGLREGQAALALACPEPARLADWARGRSTDPTGNIPRHIETCAPCGLEVEASRRNRPRLAAPVRAAVKTTAYRWVGFAAAAGLALGLGLGIAIDQLGGPSRSPAAPHGGPADLLQLMPSLRGAGDVPRYRLSAGQAFVPVATLPELPHGASDDEVFRFSILVAGGGEVWSQELTAAAIQSRLAVSGVLVLLVPAGVLEHGDYSMRIAPSAPRAPALLDASFAVD